MFSSFEECQLVLEASFFDWKPFIIIPWTPAVASVREHVLSFFVWVYFSHIPSALQPFLGLNFLAYNIGKLKCFDSNTIVREKLMYVKALTKIIPNKPLPFFIPAELAVRRVVDVCVHDGWIPDIGTTCHSFRHIAIACRHSVGSATAPKIPSPHPSS